MKNVTICYIGGGSKNWAQKYFSDLVLQDKICGTMRLYDIDKTMMRVNKKYFEKLMKNNAGKVNTEWKCETYTDINKALTGCDIVIISILPYKMINMYHDVHHAEKYGIYQPVGDTVGVGGYSRALRTLGTYKYFALKIKENCPNAWVINYTNPMSMCTNALFFAFPEIKAFGCCHEVFSSQIMLCDIMDMYNALDEEGKKCFMNSDLKGTMEALKKTKYTFDNFKNLHPDTDRHEIYTNVQGINHFTFINKANYKNVDLMPLYKAFVPMHEEYTKQHLVKFDIYQKNGIFGAAGDRHLSEFIPERFLPLGKKDYNFENGFNLTTVRFRIRRDIKQKWQLKFKAYCPFVKLKPVASGEEGTRQLIALMGLGDLISNVNILNHGQAKDMPRGTAVETNAKFTENHIKAIDCGVIKDPYIHDRVALHATNQKEFVEAYFKQDKPALRAIFKRDPQVARLSSDQQDKLFDELIHLNRKCLEDWLLK